MHCHQNTWNTSHFKFGKQLKTVRQINSCLVQILEAGPSSIHQMALSLFRLIAAVARTEALANTLGSFTLLLILILGGFLVAKGKLLFSVFIKCFLSSDFISLLLILHK